jgi:hypothetical protein
MDDQKRFAGPVELRKMGREWAFHCRKWGGAEPTTTGNLEHDRACAETWLALTGQPPSWYSREHHGTIRHPDRPQSVWEE